MAMKVFEVEFGKIGSETSIRFDVDFMNFNKTDVKEIYTFKDLFVPIILETPYDHHSDDLDIIL